MMEYKIRKTDQMTTVIALAAAIFLLSACVTPHGVTKKIMDGKQVHLPDWQNTGPTNIIIGLAELGSLPNARFDERLVNDTFTHQRIRFAGGRGQIDIEHLPHRQWTFSNSATERCLSEDLFRGEVREFFEKQEKAISFGRITWNREPGKRAGWIVVVNVTKDRKKCVFARQCFRSRGKFNPRIDERFDTAVRLRICDENWEFDRVKAWMEGMDIVLRGYKPGQGGA